MFTLFFHLLEYYIFLRKILSLNFFVLEAWIQIYTILGTVNAILNVFNDWCHILLRSGLYWLLIVLYNKFISFFLWNWMIVTIWRVETFKVLSRAAFLIAYITFFVLFCSKSAVFIFKQIILLIVNSIIFKIDIFLQYLIKFRITFYILIWNQIDFQLFSIKNISIQLDNLFLIDQFCSLQTCFFHNLLIFLFMFLIIINLLC